MKFSLFFCFLFLILTSSLNATLFKINSCELFFQKLIKFSTFTKANYKNQPDISKLQNQNRLFFAKLITSKQTEQTEEAKQDEYNEYYSLECKDDVEELFQVFINSNAQTIELYYYDVATTSSTETYKRRFYFW